MMDAGSIPNAVNRFDFHPLRAWMLWPGYVAAMNRVSYSMKSMPAMDDLEKVSEAVLRLYNEEIFKVPFDARPSGKMHFYQLVERGFRIASLAASGMNIYTFSPTLRNALGKSNLGDVRLGDLRPPYSAFYLGFEQGCGIYFGTKEQPRRWLVDGAYVMVNRPDETRDEHVWNICLTCRSRTGLLAPGYSDHWALQEEPHFTFDLKGGPEATFEEAFGEALESGNLDLEPDQEAIDDFRASIASFQDEARSSGIEVVAPVVSSRELLAEFKSHNLASARKALALTLGAVCALTSKPEVNDQDTEWPEDTPMELVAKSEKAQSPKARRNAASEIKRRGFSPVRRIDLSSFGATSHVGDSEPGRSVRPHWRSGHFRRQLHGKGRSLVSVRWIMPTVVNAGKGSVPEGRVYRVDDTSNKGATGDDV